MANLNQTARKTIRYLREMGLWATAKKAGRHFGRKSDERRFAEKMWPSQEERERQRQADFSRSLRFSVVVPLYNTPRNVLREMIESVLEQTYPDWELCLADGSDEAHGEVGEYCRQRAAEDSRIRYRKLEKNGGISENTNACLRMATGDYIALLDHDDRLMPNALYEMRDAVEKTGADFLYSDEMVFRSPKITKIIGIRVKPGFSPDTLLTNNYICHLTVFSLELFSRTEGFRSRFDGSQDHDMILRLTDRANGIAHVSKVLYLWRSIPTSVASDIGSKTYAIDAGRDAVRTFLKDSRGIDADVESTEVFPTMYRVRYPIKGMPRVRVILDARREKNLAAMGREGRQAGKVASVGWRWHGAQDRKPLEDKLWALRESVGWDACAWTVLIDVPEEDPGMIREARFAGEERDNFCQEAERKREGITWMAAEPGESRRALWSRAAEGTEEEYLLFADGVPESMGEGWLREMLSHAQHGHVGVVGARLHFQRGTLRHAGVVIGMGPERLAGRPYFMEMQEREGYFGMIAVAEDVAAVTDLMLISREKYRRARGFAAEYEDALFDVDLCLRLLEIGYYNVFTPHARLRMGRAKELSVDVGKEYASWSRDAVVFRKRNAAILKNGDPYFNPNLSPEYEDWRIRRV